MKNHWLANAFACCGTPILFYALIYGVLGLLFLSGSLFLDPDMDMATIGAILLGTAAVFPAVFLIVAYRRRVAFQRGRA